MPPINEIIAIVTALTSLSAMIMGIINSLRIKQVHVSINSRMDQLLSLRAQASKAEGAAQEREDQKNLRDAGDPT